MEHPSTINEIPTVMSLISCKREPFFSVEQGDDILQVTDYYHSQSEGTSSAHQKEIQSYYSDDSNSEENEHHLSDNLSAGDTTVELFNREEPYIRVRHEIRRMYSSSEESFGNAEIETMDSQVEESDDELTIPDYTKVDENGMDELMRFGLYTDSEESDNDPNSDELTIPDYSHVDENGMDELMRFGLYESSDGSDDKSEQLEDTFPCQSFHANATINDIHIEDSANLELSQRGDAMEVSKAVPKMDFSMQGEDLDSSDYDEDESTVVLFVGPRFRTVSFEFGEVETLNEEESVRNLSLSDSDESEVDDETELMEATAESLKMEGQDVSDRKQRRFAQINIADIAEVTEKRTESTERKAITVALEEVKEGENEESKETTVVEMTASEEAETATSHEGEEKELLPKDSSSSTCRNPEDAKPIRKKRNVLKRVARLFRECFGNSSN